MTEKHHHLVVRFSDTMFGMGDVAALHNKIVNEQGFVWFGKLGQTIAQKRVDMLNEQVAKNIPTYLYLVKGNRKKSTAYRADLLSISREEPEDKAFYPAYYAEKEIIQYMKAWMKVGKIEASLVAFLNLGKRTFIIILVLIFPDKTGQSVFFWQKITNNKAQITNKSQNSKLQIA